MLGEGEIGWLAGLYEGEGTCGAYGRGVQVAIAMTDPDVLLRVDSLFPSPTGVRTRERGARNKPIYEWRLRRRDDVAAFLQLVLPLLGERRTRQALAVLRRAQDPNGGLGSGHRNKPCCPAGHLYDEANTHVNAAGHRGCRRCRREQSRRRRAVA